MTSRLSGPVIDPGQCKRIHRQQPLLTLQHEIFFTVLKAAFPVPPLPRTRVAQAVTAPAPTKKSPSGLHADIAARVLSRLCNGDAVAAVRRRPGDMDSSCSLAFLPP